MFIRLLMIGLAMMSLSACTLEIDKPGHGYVENTGAYTVTYYEIYDGCYEEPYWFEPEWCDLYSDGECCTWYSDGWYEEWCDWGYMGCWEFNGTF